MRGGKDEDKRLGPLFPRLHVNDADKGGPRAPPRNKMALYEQLSIPSQRFNASPTLPLPQRHGPGALVPSASLSQGGGHETSVFSSCYMTRVSAESAKESHCRAADGIDIDGTRVQQGRRSISYANDRSLDAAECRSLHQPEFSHGNKSSRKKFDDDFMVPTFIHPGNAAYPIKDNPLQGTDELASMSAKSQQRSCFGASKFSILFPKSHDDSMGSSRPSSVKLRKVERCQSEQRPKETLETKGHKKSAKQMGMGENLVGPSDFPNSSSKIDLPKSKNITGNSCHGSEVQLQESYLDGASDRPKSLIGIGSAESGDALVGENGSGSKASVGSIPQSTMVTDNHNQEHNDGATGTPKLGEEERNGEVSEFSMVDSISGLEISPDDVVQVIGPKHFWKARRALVNQQRVFAIQVFELHRLIKVQKLIATSPDILLEGSPFLSTSPQKVPTKNVPKESFSKLQASTACQKDDLQKPNRSIECPTERTVGPPLPPQEDRVHGEPEVQNPRPSPCSENHLPVTVPLDHKPSAGCFQPPANQWLLPVMSPSEGLVYKPYSGPCHPSGGFMAPVYGGVGPMCLPPVAGDLMNPAYGFYGAPSGAPSIGLNYFPAPYPVPIVNPFFSASVIEPDSPLAGARPQGQSEQKSCNMSNPKSEVFSGVFSKFQASSMHRELQGSSVSNHSEEGQGEERDALRLFPTSLVSAQPSESHGNDNRARAIKVVPHNAQSAPESAARIFQSIQEERLQHDL